MKPEKVFTRGDMRRALSAVIEAYEKRGVARRGITPHGSSFGAAPSPYGRIEDSTQVGSGTADASAERADATRRSEAPKANSSNRPSSPSPEPTP